MTLNHLVHFSANQTVPSSCLLFVLNVTPTFGPDVTGHAPQINLININKQEPICAVVRLEHGLSFFIFKNQKKTGCPCNVLDRQVC